MTVTAFTVALLAAASDPTSAPPVASERSEIPSFDKQELQIIEVTPVPIPSVPPVSTPPAAPSVPSANQGNEQNSIVVTALPRDVPGDPLQDVNVESFTAIQAADRAFVGPAARAYKQILPKPVRSGVRNFLNNLHEPIVFLNFLLQLKPGKAAETVGRFAINSTAGGAGLFDVAKKRPFNFPRRPNGVANTLGYYGVKPGPFLFLPLIGATTLRDMLGGGLDGFVLPLTFGKPFNSLAYSIPTALIRGLDGRSQSKPLPQTSADGSADPYVIVRETYLKRRQAEIDDLRGKRTIVPESVPGQPPGPL